MTTFANTDRVEFRLLGPVEVWAGDTPVDIGTPKRRAVLATLLVDAGSTLTLDTLIDRVWDQTPPPRARGVLYAHLSRIRQVLAQLSKTSGQPLALERRSGGYAVRIDPDLIDLHRCRSLSERGRRADRPDAERVLALQEAVRLWRGDPLAGLSGEWTARVREGLRRQRVDLVLAWAHLELRLGRYGPVVDALYPLLAEHPTAEPLAVILMRALHAAGRTAEALDCYGMTHRNLVSELGADPGPELRAIHQAILRGELALPRRGPAARADPPAQLPLDLRGFCGRSAELDRLDLLFESTSDGSGTGVRIAAITGMPGVGKTSLALHWAHRAAAQFPDGQLYVNLRGYDPSGSPLTTAEAVRGFLDALAVPDRDVSTSVDAQVGLYRSLLADRRLLVVLDNARDAEQVRPLLPGSPHCAVLVTSRDRLSGLVAAEGAELLSLGVLSTAEARELLSCRIGAGRVAAEPEAADDIVTGCGALPLALSVVAARAAAHPGFALAALAAEIRAANDGLDAFCDGDAGTDVRSVFSWSYRTLSTDAATLFRLLGDYPSSGVLAPVVANLAGVTTARARSTLAELTRAHLLTEDSPGHYACHDLLRAYAAELVSAQLPRARAYAGPRYVGIDGSVKGHSHIVTRR